MEYVLLVMVIAMAYFIFAAHRRCKAIEDALGGFVKHCRDEFASMDARMTDIEREAVEIRNVCGNVQKSAKTLQKSRKEFEETVTEVVQGLQKQMAVLSEEMSAAREIMAEHAELEREAAKSERMFQEGLANILNYGVVKNE